MAERKLKIAVLTDSLTNRGGGEREILTLLDYFDVDLYCGIYDKENTFSEFSKRKIKYFLRKKLPSFINTMYIRYKFKKIKFNKKYDAYIYFWPAPLTAGYKTKPNIWYCNTPLRYLYDLREEFLKSYKPVIRPFVRLAMFFIQKNDQHIIKNYVNKILVNSINVQKRVSKYYHLKSEVVYPPTNIKRFKFIKFGDFYLSSGRLESNKGIHLVVRAFQKMPDKKLVILGGGVDEEKIKRMCEGYPNINFIGAVEGKRLEEYYGKCICTIYMSKKEDFGMIPVESMACGKPCIATDEGGFKETIVHKKTGYLINPEKRDNIYEIVKAVKWVEPRARKMKKSCIERAKMFNESQYIEGIKKSIREANK